MNANDPKLHESMDLVVFYGTLKAQRARDDDDAHKKPILAITANYDSLSIAPVS